jgi:aryl carrier-like protein
MLPEAVVPLERMPLNANGKIDRRALVMPAISAAPQPRPVAPRTAMERTLAQIWIQVLNLEHVGVQDNFFDLGGNSLLMMHALARTNAALGRRISMTELFRHPNIAELAASLDRPESRDTDFADAQTAARRRRERARVNPRMAKELQ